MDDEEVERSTGNRKKRKFEFIDLSDSESSWSCPSSSSDDSEEDDYDDDDDDDDEDSENIGDEDWVDTAGPREPFPAHNRGVIHKDFGENPRPKDIFDNFFPQELVELIVNETNKYANKYINLRQMNRMQMEHSRDKSWRDTNPDEIRVLLALFILQGIVVKPAHEMYFSRSKIIDTPFFCKIMPRDRFQILLSFLHFNKRQERSKSNSNYDLLQIKPVLDMLSERWQLTYTPERDISIDESLLQWKGRFKWKIYVPRKRNKLGIKSYKLCESSTGYVYNLMIYSGDKTGIPDKIQDIDLENFDKPAQIVLTLMESLLNQGHRLYVDNFYASPKLFDALVEKKTDAVGTVRRNRKGMPKKLTLRNDTLAAYYRKKLMALKWISKREVYMLSTVHDNNMKTYSNIYKQPVTKPKVIFDYNRGMGGVDLSDQRIANYSLARRRTKKCYIKFFFHLLDITILNSFIIYKKCGHDITHLKFRTELIKDIIDHHLKGDGLRKRRTYEHDIAISQRLLGNHFICRNQISRSTDYTLRRACVVCSANNVRRDVRYSCRQCDVALCAVPCFEIFHTQEHF
ncbi:piggyBac transposable element-derived protein 4-like [Centruroides sculpturatus]|uniref:piggyBac transposable element-derived protein 4-like n=1 Tax=Centruroides sculpturatus TaxID=218467 RepID=UPI000C6CB463|nr:piggyBac transposable element-derived protein 4-like [Centruroides sculpturatus]